jgi:hypothetical protein
VSKIDLLREMYTKMTEGKDASVLPVFYHPDFRMFMNGQEQGYADFLRLHEEVYEGSQTYVITHDEDAWIDGGDRVAGRCWLTTTVPGEEPTETEIVYLAAFSGDQIHSIRQLTWPQWEPDEPQEGEQA